MTAGKQPRRVIRVLLLGEQHLVLDGLRLVLEQEEEFVVVRIGTTHDPGIADVIVFDINGRANDLLTVLTPNLPQRTHVLILGSRLDGDTLALAFRHGVKGAVLKKERPSVFFDAIRQVADGQVWLSRSGTTDLLAELTAGDGVPTTEGRRTATLTKRERQVVALVGEGLRNQQMATRLHISEVTVRNHLTNIFRKLKVKSRFQLALYAFKHRLSKLPPKAVAARATSASTPRRRTSAS